MSSVLRKKIQAGAGIPPAILQFHEFWDPLQAKVAAWVFETYGVEVSAFPESRRVVPGNIAKSQLEGLLSFVFDQFSSPGICAIAIDETGSALNAARRLDQNPDDLEGVSPLFQKLLFETSALSLWRLAATGLSGHSHFGSDLPTADFSGAAGGFEPTERYLIVSYSCPVGTQRFRFMLVLNLEFIRHHAIEFEQNAERQKSFAQQRGRETLRESVKTTMVTIEGILDEVSMSIGQCSRLQVGNLIALPDVNTARVSLRAETVNGSVEVGHGEMGVWKRQRALKLKTPILEPFTRELAKL
jgi:hypothetical protein